MRICSVEGCNGSHLSLGYCNTHYLRSKRNKNILMKSCYDLSIEERLLKFIKINELTGCWIWQGAKNRKGYGQLSYKNKNTIAHRLSYEVFNGEIPKDMLICHHCDRPECIRPDHLFLGTLKDNAQDMLSKKRNVPMNGSSNGNSKLKDEDVVIIKQKLKSGMTFASISREYNVSETTIAYIQKEKTWRHIN